MPYLNELEIITTTPLKSMYIFANQFQSNNIYLIDLRTGQVLKTWDLEELLVLEQAHILSNS